MSESGRQYDTRHLGNARTLRRENTDAEGLLWSRLRDRGLDGYKFRRQQPIGPYIADFACMPEKLLIELEAMRSKKQRTSGAKNFYGAAAFAFCVSGIRRSLKIFPVFWKECGKRSQTPPPIQPSHKSLGFIDSPSRGE